MDEAAAAATAIESEGGGGGGASFAEGGGSFLSSGGGGGGVAPGGGSGGGANASHCVRGIRELRGVGMAKFGNEPDSFDVVVPIVTLYKIRFKKRRKASLALRAQRPPKHALGCKENIDGERGGRESVSHIHTQPGENVFHLHLPNRL